MASLGTIPTPFTQSYLLAVDVLNTQLNIWLDVDRFFFLCFEFFSLLACNWTQLGVIIWSSCKVNISYQLSPPPVVVCRNCFFYASFNAFYPCIISVLVQGHDLDQCLQRRDQNLDQHHQKKKQLPNLSHKMWEWSPNLGQEIDLHLDQCHHHQRGDQGLGHTPLFQRYALVFN